MADPRALLEAKIKDPNSTLDDSEITEAIKFCNEDIQAYNQLKSAFVEKTTKLINEFKAKFDTTKEPSKTTLSELEGLLAKSQTLPPGPPVTDPRKTRPGLTDDQITTAVKGHFDTNVTNRRAQISLDQDLQALEEKIGDEIKNALITKLNQTANDFKNAKDNATREYTEADALTKRISSKGGDDEGVGALMGSVNMPLLIKFNQATAALKVRKEELDKLTKIEDANDDADRQKFTTLEKTKATQILINDSTSVRAEFETAVRAAKQTKIDEIRNKCKAEFDKADRAADSHKKDEYIDATVKPLMIDLLTKAEALGEISENGITAVNTDSTLADITAEENRINVLIGALQQATSAYVTAYDAVKAEAERMLAVNAATAEPAAVDLRNQLKADCDDILATGLALHKDTDINSIDKVSDNKVALQIAGKALNDKLAEYDDLDLTDQATRTTFANSAQANINGLKSALITAVDNVNTAIGNEYLRLQAEEMPEINRALALYNKEYVDVKKHYDQNLIDDIGQPLADAVEEAAKQLNLIKTDLSRSIPPTNIDGYIALLATQRAAIQDKQIPDQINNLETAINDYRVAANAHILYWEIKHKAARFKQKINTECSRTDAKSKIDPNLLTPIQTKLAEIETLAETITIDPSTGKSEKSPTELKTISDETRQKLNEINLAYTAYKDAHDKAVVAIDKAAVNTLQDDIDVLIDRINQIIDPNFAATILLAQISDAKDPTLQQYETDISTLLERLTQTKTHLADAKIVKNRAEIDDLLDDRNPDGIQKTIDNLLFIVDEARDYAAPLIANYVGSHFKDYVKYIMIAEGNVDAGMRGDTAQPDKFKYTVADLEHRKYALDIYRMQMVKQNKNKEAQLAHEQIKKLDQIIIMLTQTPDPNLGVPHFSDKSLLVNDVDPATNNPTNDLVQFEKNIEQIKKDILANTDFDPTPGGGVKNIIASRAAGASKMQDRFTRGFAGLSTLKPYEGRVNHNVSTDGKTASLSVQRIKDGECITEKSFLSKNGKEVYDDSTQRVCGASMTGPLFGYKLSSNSAYEDALIFVLEHIFANQAESIKKSMVDTHAKKILNGEIDPVLRQAARREVLDIRGSFKDTYAQAILDVCGVIGAESHDKRNPRGRKLIKDSEITEDRLSAVRWLFKCNKDTMLTKTLGTVRPQSYVEEKSEKTTPRGKIG